MMGFEEELKKHAKTSREIERTIVDWRETFTKGAMGNQEAYAEARDTREELERAQWVRVEDAVAVHRLQLEKLQHGIKEAIDVYDVIAFFDKHEIYYDEWLKSKVFQLLEEIRAKINERFQEELEGLLKKGDTPK